METEVCGFLLELSADGKAEKIFMEKLQKILYNENEVKFRSPRVAP